MELPDSGRMWFVPALQGSFNETLREEILINRRHFMAAGGAAGALGLAGGWPGTASAQAQFSIATGTTGAVYYPLGGAMANILSAARADERRVEELARQGIKATVSDIPTAAEGER